MILQNATTDNRIIVNPDILSESYLLADLRSRESKLNNINTCLRPITYGGKPVNCWLYGRPGVGKTVTGRWILRKLENKTGIRGVYINCWENPTFFSVLEYIARELRMLGAEKLSTSFKLDRLKRHLLSQRLIIFLDEIDQPPPKERNTILYNLSDLPTVGLICACNSQHTYFGLEERVKSRLNPSQIYFEEYSGEKILAILDQRAREALIDDSYSEKILREIALLTCGDARIAIQTLKHAAYLAEKDKSKNITRKHISISWNAAKNIKKSYMLRKLTDHHRLLYKLIAKNPKILSGDLWRQYLNICDKKSIIPIAIRTYSDYCNELIKCGLVKSKRAAIQGKVREFHAIR